MAKQEQESFVPLDELSEAVVRDFVSLLSELSTGFAGLEESNQHASVMENLKAALESPDTTVLVHREEGSGGIVSTATGNIVVGEAWVDDVVTLEIARGQGLGRMAMNALHSLFKRASVETVRLTSNPERETARNLYVSTGYIEGGQVWRAPLDAARLDVEPQTGLFTPVNCLIPTGNKAWVYGPNPEAGDATILLEGLQHAASTLTNQGIESVNYFTLRGLMPAPELAEALNQFGFTARDTGLYTKSLAIRH